MKSAKNTVKTCLQYVFSHRISRALIVVCIFKSRNNLTDFLGEVTGEGMWFVCFLLRLLQSLLPTAHRRRTLLVNTLLVRSGKSFILSTNLRSVRWGFFCYLSSFLVGSLRCSADELAREFVGLGVTNGLTVLWKCSVQHKVVFLNFMLLKYIKSGGGFHELQVASSWFYLK